MAYFNKGHLEKTQRKIYILVFLILTTKAGYYDHFEDGGWILTPILTCILINTYVICHRHNMSYMTFMEE